jgi:hypothetical protein
VPIPSIGLTVSTRVCDRCYNTNSLGLTSSFTADANQTSGIGSLVVDSSVTSGKVEEKPERERERRSAVVDELASRIHSKLLASTT